ncbi:MAG: hypothetical protein U0166_16155 [Acidobacteriota bacterium]
MAEALARILREEREDERVEPCGHGVHEPRGRRCVDAAVHGQELRGGFGDERRLARHEL